MKNKIITISREFGSGGRELGKRMADELGYAYYDRETVTEIAKRIAKDETYVSTAFEKGVFLGIPIHYNQTLAYVSPQEQDKIDLLVETKNLLTEFAEKGNCIIVGRAAGVFLQEYNPFNIFVYADMAHRIQRCMNRANEHESYTEQEFENKIRQIDKDRANYYGLVSKNPWGDKSGYHLCVNTSDKEIKQLAPMVAAYAKAWLG